MPNDERRDPWLVVLEVVLIAVVVAAPLPFGAVRGHGRLAFEIAGVALLAAWAARHVLRGGPLPSRIARVAVFGLIALACVQALPLGESAVRAVAPGAAALRDSVAPPPDVRDAERAILGRDPGALDRAWSLSLAPDATLRSVRTGCALAGVWLAAFAVVAEASSRRLAFAVLASGAFQATYGILVLASGYDRIWGVPKAYFLDCATGTFVNRNHFANFVAVAAAVGAALTLFVADRVHRRARRGLGWVTWLDAPAGRMWLVLGLTAATVAGLLVSFSRAGIVVGLLGIAVVIARSRGGRTRFVIAAALLAAAVVPLLRVGPDRLVERFSETGEDLRAPISRPRVWADAVRMGAAMPLAGAGFGSFAEVYPAFRSPEIRYRFDHAHDDLVQAFAEGGTVGLALVLLLAAGHARAWFEGVRGDRGILGIGFAAALLAACLHALVDFPFHIPADAALIAAVAGATLGMPWNRRP